MFIDYSRAEERRKEEEELEKQQKELAEAEARRDAARQARLAKLVPTALEPSSSTRAAKPTDDADADATPTTKRDDATSEAVAAGGDGTDDSRAELERRAAERKARADERAAESANEEQQAAQKAAERQAEREKRERMRAQTEAAEAEIAAVLVRCAVVFRVFRFL